MMYLLVDFLVLRVMIWYHIMIPLSPLFSLIAMPYQIFAYVACMILAIIYFLNNTMIYYSNEQYIVEIYKLSSAIIK
jgi:hypothetical protein